ncbi:hypothetical protein EEL53_11095 [Muribaculaceae bacterium Isolate-114 (HZI)]|nr:hypothetical protein EEL53_11095 [Muribaculaceae bacterium Isolate-114 (HZI)]
MAEYRLFLCIHYNLTLNKMKKLLMVLAMLIGIAGYGFAKDIYAHDASVLPKAAQSIIAKNFKAKVSVVKMDKDFGRVTEYEAILADGTEISFDRDGNWDNIEVNKSKSVPAALVPKGIRNFVAKQQPGQRIVGIDKERSGYDVELTNGIDLKFNKAGQFIRYDD